VKRLLVLLILLNIADGYITRSLMQFGLAREGNPLLLRLVGDSDFIFIKVLGSTVCAMILWDVYRRHPKLALSYSGLAVAFYTLIVFWNTSLFFR
jgi:hypothetical protein